MSTQSESSAPKSGGYDVARPSGRCAITGVELPVGTRFMAALRETPAGFERIDVALDAWEQFDRAGCVAFWQAVMPAAEQKKKLFVSDEVLCELFERLATVEEPAKVNFRFVLGLVLMRKRLLNYLSSRVEADRELWSMRFKGREESLDMVNPKLDEAALAEVSQQMGQILNEEV